MAGYTRSAQKSHHRLGAVTLGTVVDWKIWRINGLDGILGIDSSVMPTPPDCHIQGSVDIRANHAAQTIKKQDGKGDSRVPCSAQQDPANSISGLAHLDRTLSFVDETWVGGRATRLLIHTSTRKDSWRADTESVRSSELCPLSHASSYSH